MSGTLGLTSGGRREKRGRAGRSGWWLRVQERDRGYAEVGWETGPNGAAQWQAGVASAVVANTHSVGPAEISCGHLQLGPS